MCIERKHWSGSFPKGTVSKNFHGSIHLGEVHQDLSGGTGMVTSSLCAGRGGGSSRNGDVNHYSNDSAVMAHTAEPVDVWHHHGSIGLGASDLW
eukprot:m.58396 g.58396  ORF g.58396 m.58396 type:complete len:94 (+) comp15649_c1_seq1:465-746(+)